MKYCSLLFCNHSRLLSVFNMNVINKYSLRNVFAHSLCFNIVSSKTYKWEFNNCGVSQSVLYCAAVVTNFLHSATTCVVFADCRSI